MEGWSGEGSGWEDRVRLHVRGMRLLEGAAAAHVPPFAQPFCRLTTFLLRRYVPPASSSPPPPLIALKARH